MTCTGCEAAVVVGSADLADFPKLWRIGYDKPVVSPLWLEVDGMSEKVSAAASAGVSTPTVEGNVSRENVSSAWYDPVAAQGGKAAEQSLELRSGWRFTPNTPPAEDSNDPTDIYVVPLRYRVTLVDGTCSGSGATCSTGSACRGLFEIDLEVTSTKRTLAWPDEGLESFPTPKTPTSAGVADPNAEAQNIQITYGSGVGYHRKLGEDPRGTDPYIDDDGDDTFWHNNVTKVMTVSFFIEPSACGEAACWTSNLEDWLMHFDGYTMQTDDLGHVPDVSFFMAIYCDPCKPVSKPGGGDENLGSQGGGKNFNQSSI